MIKIAFSEADRKALNYERYHHPHPRVQRKMEALWLKSQELPHKEICRLTGISKGTLCTYLHAYQQGGIEKLKELNFYRPVSELATHSSTLEEHFRQHPPASLKQAMATIEQLTGIKRSEVQIRHFLKALGMKPRKVGMIPAKADVDKQETFKQEELEPRLEQAKADQRAVFFTDAAHFVLAPFLGGAVVFLSLVYSSPGGSKTLQCLSRPECHHPPTHYRHQRLL